MVDDRWAAAERLLCVRLDALGDVLMSTPAIRAVKRSRPGRRVTLLTSPGGAAAAELVPDVDDVIVYDAPWVKATARRADSRPDRAMIDCVRDGRFDAAVIFTVYSQNPLPAAMLCYLADIPLRLAHCHENPYQLLTDWVPDPEPQRFTRHEVRRQLDLVATVGCRTVDEQMAVRLPPAAEERVDEILAGRDIAPDDRWAVMHVGASAPSRRYPPELFAAAARGLAAQGVRLVFTGSAAEEELIEQVRAGVDGYSESLAGELSLAELAALLRRAPVLVSNNTGPVHVASAVGTPVVDLYALTNPQHTPWAVPCRVLSHHVPCRNCYKSVCPEGHNDCLRKVPPTAVVEATLELLSDRLGRSPRANGTYASRGPAA